MSYFSFVYIAFLAFAALIYYVLPRAARAFWLLACSYVFYLYNPANIGFVGLLISASAITWGAALIMQRAKNTLVRRLILGVSILGCLIPLLYFKYSNFFIESASGLLSALGIKQSAQLLDLALPLGISYFTFAAIGYAIDVYTKKQRAEKNFLYYALFVGFFPCLFTGPIERAGRVLPQIKKPPKFSYSRFSGGVFRILFGVFKKLVIADNIGRIVALVFKMPAEYNGGVLLAASLLFTLQLYMDFSGCSDIAIGTGAIFGIELCENFKAPLLSTTFTGFWSRWHISLTSWLEDYIFVPLVWSDWHTKTPFINKLKSGKPVLLCLFIVFIISGFWHGASWGYIVWGIMNGAFLVIGKASAQKRKRLNKKNPFFQKKLLMPFRVTAQVIFTYLLFTLTLVIFWNEMFASGLQTALPSYGNIFLNGHMIFTDFNGVATSFSVLGFGLKELMVIGIGSVFCLCFEAAKNPVNIIIRKIPIFLRWPIYYALILSVLCFGVFGQSAFIYQNF